MYGKGVAAIYLGRQGQAEIHPKIIGAMNNYKLPKVEQSYASPFSYDEKSISFTRTEETYVNLQRPSPDFKNWFEQIPIKKSIDFKSLANYKVDANTISINTGPGTAGIQIKKRGDNYLVCNNVTADSKAPNQEAREQNLKNHLVSLSAIESISSMDMKSEQTREYTGPGKT